MARHSFILESKLHDICGRVDYISNPKRQEHLYATYSTVTKDWFWKLYADQCQFDFKTSGQKGTCIEGREFVIAMPAAMTKYDPNILVQLLVAKFQEAYPGTHCCAAIHHNKAMTNYHCHLIFTERDVLEKSEPKIATRNMFYNEQGKHVRTKKEIQNPDGSIRDGCFIIQKGEAYEMRYFTPKKEVFKSSKFLADVKIMYTELLNQFLEEKDQLTVFQKDGPYLATKKIGKNNPKAEEIRQDNALRQEWNDVVDQLLVADVPEEEIITIRQDEIAQKVKASVLEHGSDPKRFSAILIKAIEILRAVLHLLMEEAEKKVNKIEEVKDHAAESSVNESSHRLERLAQTSISHSPEVVDQKKGSRPSSKAEELQFMKMKVIKDELRKKSQKKYAIDKKLERAEAVLDAIPDSIFHRKDRKAAQEEVQKLQTAHDEATLQLQAVAEANGFKTVNDAEKAYWAAKKNLEKVQRAQAIWDGKPVPEEVAKRPSALAKLKELQAAQTKEKNMQLQHKKQDIDR